MFRGRTPDTQSSSLAFDFPGLSIPKKEEGRLRTSRSLFTKAEKEETQLPMKWSDWPKMYKSIWAKSGWRLTTFTCRGHSGNHKLAGLSFRSRSRSLGLKARKAFVCETYLTLSTLQFTLSVHDNNQVWLHSCLEFLLLEVQNYSFYVSLYGGNVSTTKKKNTKLKYNGVRFTCSFQIFYRPIDYICKKN